MRTILTVAAAFFLLQSLPAQGVWVVQVGAFDQKMPLGYFVGIAGVYEVKDHNDIYHYYIGGFKNQKEAQAAADNAQKSGFRAYPINIEEREQQCHASCREDAAPARTGWIFFDYDRADLRPDSRRKLEKLAEILRANPSFRATLTGHTDSHGSDEYNRDLSTRRVESAKNYLASLGIDARRLTLDHFGEAKPIAKNESNGSDTPAGRQLNRRVELTIVDEKGNERPDMMDEAVVPSGLRQ